MSNTTGPLKVVLALSDGETREQLKPILEHLGHQVVPAESGQQFIDLCHALEPDLIISAIKLPDMDALEAATTINREREVPLILVSADHDAALLTRAGADHVMGYLIKPIRSLDVEAAISLAMVRFRQFQEIREQARTLQQALENRKVIERAKGIAMRRLGIDEQEAFRRLKRLASDRNWKLIELAQSVVKCDEFLQLLERV